MYLRLLNYTESGTPSELLLLVCFDGLIIKIKIHSLNDLILNSESFQLNTNDYSIDAAIWYKCEVFDQVFIDLSTRTVSAAISQNIFLASTTFNSSNQQHFSVNGSTMRVQMDEADQRCLLTLAGNIFEQFSSSNHNSKSGSSVFDSLVRVLHVYLLPALQIGINADDRDFLLKYHSQITSRITNLEKELLVLSEKLDRARSDVCAALADLLGVLQESSSVERFSTALLISLFGSLQNEIARMTQSVWGHMEADEPLSPTSEAARNQVLLFYLLPYFIHIIFLLIIILFN